LLRRDRWWVRHGLLLEWAIVSDVGYIVVRLKVVRKKIVIIRWKRRKTLDEVKVVICGLAIVCR
jgi:hypothetical protein